MISFFEPFYFVAKRFTATVSVIKQTLDQRETTLDLSERKLFSNWMDVLKTMFKFRSRPLANIQLLNLSYNNLGELPQLIPSLLENLTHLFVKDNRLSSLSESKDVKGNPLTEEERKSIIKHVKTTRTIFVDIEGNVSCKYGNKSFTYSSTMFS